jgi:hypothetical protein
MSISKKIFLSVSQITIMGILDNTVGQSNVQSDGNHKIHFKHASKYMKAHRHTMNMYGYRYRYGKATTTSTLMPSKCPRIHQHY